MLLSPDPLTVLIRQVVPPAGILAGLEKEMASLEEIVPHLEKLYCGGIGLEVGQMTVIKVTVGVALTIFTALLVFHP